MSHWRTGHRNARNIYWHDSPGSEGEHIGVMFNPADAEMAVRALNQLWGDPPAGDDDNS